MLMFRSVQMMKYDGFCWMIVRFTAQINDIIDSKYLPKVY